MARPRIALDYELIAKLAHIQCTQVEIAAILNVSVDTLLRRRRFCELYKKGIEEGKSSLRRLQWKKAQEGNATMMIWLGKQYLGQRDTHEVSGPGGGPLDIKFIVTKALDEV